MWIHYNPARMTIQSLFGHPMVGGVSTLLNCRQVSLSGRMPCLPLPVGGLPASAGVSTGKTDQVKLDLDIVMLFWVKL